MNIDVDYAKKFLFFFLGISDRVQCAFCQGYLLNFEEGDNIKELHPKYFKDCSMAKKSN